MSFSADVKQELSSVDSGARHCRIAEIAAFVRLIGYREVSSDDEEEQGVLTFRSENEAAMRKLFTLLEGAFNINVSVAGRVTRGGNRTIWTASVEDPVQAEKLQSAVSHASVLRMECCRKAFLRGAFLAAGSISAPEKYYHLEYVCEEQETAELVQSALRSLLLDARTVRRKNDYIVYLKEGDQIVSLLGAMGASVSFLNLETIRVMKEMRGSVNRRVNCETANLNKVVVSAVRQIEDIRYLRDNGGFAELSPALREMAEVRLEYPEAPLAELGGYLNPKIGKSGVNHRLRKLSAIAEDLRNKRMTSLS